MILSRTFIIEKDKWLNEQFNLSTLLYNQGRHFINEHYKKESKFLSYFDLDKLLKNLTELNYYKQMCKAQVAQQCLKQLNSNYTSYFKALKDFKVNPSKYKGMPKVPKFKTEQNLITFTYQIIKIKDQFIVINKEHKVHIPDEVYKEELNNFKTISFIPFYNKIKVVIVYETKELNVDLNLNDYLSVDLGMNNLCSCVSKDDCFILNGKPLKSINQYFNKELSKLRSERPLKGKYQDYNYNSFKIKNLSLKRELKIADILHKASKYLVDYCVKHKIGTIVFGRNKEWKDSIQLGKQTNQNFVSIPFYKLLKMLEYKCKMIGINLVTQEESYTSKCDSLAFEEVKCHDKYKGSRIKRGLFLSSLGKVLNADINGALNILRKYLHLKEVDEFPVIQEIIDRGLLYRPYRISFY
jgi:putative transposase